MVPLRLFRSRPIAAGNAATFSVFALLMAMVFFMAQFLETGLGYGPLGAGLRLLPGWATLTVIAPFAGSLINRMGSARRHRPGLGYPQHPPPARRVFGVAICAAVFAARGHYASPATFVAGFGPAMAACAGLALLGAAAGLVIPGRRQAPASAVPVQIHAPKIEIRR